MLIASEPPFQHIDPDKPFLPQEATIEAVRLEISSWKVDKPSVVSFHTALIKVGTTAYQFATCYEIINEKNGELHHYAIEIINVQKYKAGWFIKDRYRISDLNQLYALQEFLTFVKEGQLGSETQTRILVNKQDYLKFEKLDSEGKISIIESILSQVDGFEKIIAQGGNNFLAKLVDWFIENQSSEEVIERFQDLLNIIGEIKGEERLKVIEAIRKQNLSKEDLDILSGRKEGLEEFEKNLDGGTDWDEKKWQEFFELNTWIFGYGLDYRFLQILQREAYLSSSDLDGKNTVTGDFLAGCCNFTVLVELKRPDTALFKQTQNRADSWKLSSDLMDAVSQILSQKANWTIKGDRENFNDAEELITQKTYDPKTLLIIGHTNQFRGEDRTSRIKKKTFELFRRNLRNIEILTFDEILERARFIVKP